MSTHLLSVDATESSELPARITRLLAQRRVRVVSLHMTRCQESGAWSVRLFVDLCKPVELDLLIKRLNRVIDVVRVRAIDTPQREAASRPPRSGRTKPADRSRTRSRGAP